MRTQEIVLQCRPYKQSRELLNVFVCEIQSEMTRYGEELGASTTNRSLKWQWALGPKSFGMDTADRQTKRRMCNKKLDGWLG